MSASPYLMIVRAAGVRLATPTPPLSSPDYGQIRKQKVRSAHGLYPPESDVLANRCRRRRRNRVAPVVVRKHGVEHSCRRTVVMAAQRHRVNPIAGHTDRRRRRQRSSQPTARPHRRLHPHRPERRLNGRLQQLIIDGPAMGAPSPPVGTWSDTRRHMPITNAASAYGDIAQSSLSTDILKLIY